MAEALQEVSNQEVTLAYVDQGYTGQNPANAALEHGIALEVVKLPEAKRGFALLPRRRGGERSFGWAARFRRLAGDYERLPETVAGLHYLAFACLMLPHLTDAMNVVQNMLWRDEMSKTMSPCRCTYPNGGGEEPFQEAGAGRQTDIHFIATMAALAEAMTETKMGTFLKEVPIVVSNWRARQDSNPRPLGS